jgi:hypothetical protein
MAPAAKRKTLLDLAIWLGLILSTLVIYSQVRSFDFVNYDDPVYVYQNAHVQGGLTVASVKWAFTAVVDGNWIPITLLSHILDGQLFGMQSEMHHLVNVIFHELSALGGMGIGAQGRSQHLLLASGSLLVRALH